LSIDKSSAKLSITGEAGSFQLIPADILYQKYGTGTICFFEINKMTVCVVYRLITNNSPVDELAYHLQLSCAIPPVKDVPRKSKGVSALQGDKIDIDSR